jgi:hypothetical protein
VLRIGIIRAYVAVLKIACSAAVKRYGTAYLLIGLAKFSSLR